MTRDEPSIEEQLDSLFADGHIAEVLHVVKSGKEGTVYCCRGGPLAGAELVAAKAYHQMDRRGFRNDAIYQTERVRGPGTRRMRTAMARKSSFGRKAQFNVWVTSEFQTLRALYEAGADVPRPIACTEGALLMEYVGDYETAAPSLIAVELDRAEASLLFERVIRNVALWLDRNYIHADLSPYNVLYWHGEVTIIDFPQAVDPRFNPSARALLERDLANICRYFSRFGVHADSQRLAHRLWSAFRHGASTG
jgi:RIO kinase 1